MRKIISIIFGFLFLFQVALFLQEPEIISTIEVTRAEVQTTAGTYLKLTTWKPTKTSVTLGTETFNSWFNPSIVRFFISTAKTGLIRMTHY